MMSPPLLPRLIDSFFIFACVAAVADAFSLPPPLPV